ADGERVRALAERVAVGPRVRAARDAGGRAVDRGGVVRAREVRVGGAVQGVEGEGRQAALLDGARVREQLRLGRDERAHVLAVELGQLAGVDARRERAVRVVRDE